MGWFKKKQNKKSSEPAIPVSAKPTEYSAKIILSWIESLKGNKEISSWLLKNGYEEIVKCNLAIRLDSKSRDWLMTNGYPQLMAFVNASEGNANAQRWLELNKFTLLHHMALAIEDEKDSRIWLKNNSTYDILELTKLIRTVKDNIEETHNDVHSFGKD
ncbi:MAG: hypothetical protein ACI9XP_000616 [Lentimonas sp.]|jgi:hypothetical protein